MKLRNVIVLGLVLSLAVAASQVRGQAEEDNSLGARLKRVFARHTPTPTPTPKKKKVRKKSSPSPTGSPTATPADAGETSSPATTTSPESTAEETPAMEVEEPSATASPEKRESHTGQTQTFEPVRPIAPPPGSRRSKAETSPAQENAPETPAPASGAPSRKSGATATIAASDVTDYDNYPTEVRKIIDSGLELTTKKMSYKYNSADPAKGGMDSSGFIYYVLSQAGIKDVPRDARDQYVWVRKAGNFQAVLSQKDDTFELDALKPGDLLFWASTSGSSGEPDVTQTMIYIGREKGTNQRVMIGASDGRNFKGQQRNGVSAFEFKVGRVKNPKSDEPGPTFVGYAKIPGLAAD